MGDLQIAPTTERKTLMPISMINDQSSMINDLCSVFTLVSSFFTLHSSLFTLHYPLPFVQKSISRRFLFSGRFPHRGRRRGCIWVCSPCRVRVVPSGSEPVGVFFSSGEKSGSMPTCRMASKSQEQNSGICPVCKYCCCIWWASASMRSREGGAGGVSSRGVLSRER